VNVRVECESCRELVAASFAIQGGEVRATCPLCHHAMTALRAPRAHAPSLQMCPKCGAPRGAGDACAICGLATARMAAYKDAREAAVPEVVREAWQRANEAWDDPARHDELLRVVAANDSYAWAAGRYRTRKDDVSQRQLERLRRAAEATLLASASARPDASTQPYRATRGVLIILVVAVVIGLVYAMVIRTRGPASRDLAAPARPAGQVQPLVPGHPVSSSTIK